MSTDPNSFDQEIKDVQTGTNPEAPKDQGTGGEGAPKNPPAEGAQPVDYAVKFAESSKEALRLLEENKKKDEEIARLAALANQPAAQTAAPTESLYPGFEELDPQAQANLIAYTNAVTKRALDGVYKDPSIKFARDQYNTNKWEQAFAQVVDKFPELKDSKDEFKAKYFKVDNVPDNIGNILLDVAKIHLFDKAKDIGAQEEAKRQEGRIELERPTTGGTPTSSTRTLEDWTRLAQENPAQFAKLSKEFNADLARLKS